MADRGIARLRHRKRHTLEINFVSRIFDLLMAEEPSGREFTSVARLFLGSHPSE